MPNHLLGHSQVDVVLAVVHLELEADKVGQDGGGPGLGADGSDLLAGHGALDGETMVVDVGVSEYSVRIMSYGTVW